MSFAAEAATTNEYSRATDLRTRWRYALPSPSDASIAVSGNMVVAGDRKGNVVAMSAGEGKVIWQAKLAASVSSQAAITPDAVFVGDEDGTLHALAAGDGKEFWQSKTGGKIVGRPLVVGDQVVAGSYDNLVYCFDAKTGKTLWTFTTNAQVHAGPAEFAGVIVTGGCDGFLRGIVPKTGRQKWEFEVGGAIATTPQVHGKFAIVATMDGLVCAVDDAGRVAWKATPLADSATYTVTPTLVGGRVVVIADDGRVAAVNVADGGNPAIGRITGRPGGNLLVVGDQALIGTDEGKMIAIDPKTAAPAGSITVGGTVTSLAREGDRIFAGTGEGVVWMLEGKRQTLPPQTTGDQ